MSNPHIQQLLSFIVETEDCEIGCDECFNLLDSYAETLFNGEDPEQVMPGVKQHLKHCFCCEHELEALLVMLKEITASGGN
jgi:hypothetical protein